MSLFTSLSIGVSGLTVSQRAINATAHNLSNVDTDGYVRQQTLMENAKLTTIGYTAVNYQQVGYGAETQVLRQVRDEFLDKSYRKEYGRQGYYEAQYDAVSEIENLFGELQGVAFQDSMEDIWTAIQEVAKEPSSIVTRATLVETAVSFLERANNISTQLRQYQLNLNTQIQAKVDRINEIGDMIYEMNQKIGMYEASDIEQANDYRDQRNCLLDELSKMVNITYREQENNRVTVNVEGVSFVEDDTVFHMETMTMREYEEKQNPSAASSQTAASINASSANFYVPVWPAYGYAQVFNLDHLTSNSSANSDIGALKGILIARGSKVGNYTDIPIRPLQESFTDEDGYFDEDAYNTAIGQYEGAVSEYALRVDTSSIVAAQSQFDQLIHGIVTTLNDLFCPNKQVTLDDGSVISILDEEVAPVGIDEASTVGTELFSRRTMPRYTEQEITLADGTVMTAQVYNEEHADNLYSLYSIEEMEVNPLIIEDQSKLPLSENNGAGDYDMELCARLLSKWQEPFATLSPNTLTKCNFNDYYNMFTGEIAVRGEEMYTVSTNQAVMAESIKNQNLSLTAVAASDELTYLIKYQHAYNAASRYVNVISQMLEHIIERLG